MQAPQVIGSVFHGPGGPGDFRWMIEQPEYADVLFVFNDNEGEFRHHRAGHHGGGHCGRGSGNAVIRPYQDLDPPRAAGIPTGSAGGYPALTDHVRSVVDEALGAIRELLATGRYRRVMYSAADETGALGTGIFDVAPEVKAYIVAGLRALAAPGH